MTTPDPPRYRVHPSPIGDILIVTTDDGIVTLHPFAGALHTELERVSVQLRALPVPDDSGDRDGVTDAVGPDGADFGHDRLVEIVSGSNAATADDLVAHVVAAVEAFSGSAVQTDDVTVAVVQYHGQ